MRGGLLAENLPLAVTALFLTYVSKTALALRVLGKLGITA
jgi:hypothetical protein